MKILSQLDLKVGLHSGTSPDDAIDLQYVEIIWIEEQFKVISNEHFVQDKV